MTSEMPLPAPDNPPSLGRRIVMFPLVRLIFAFFWVAVAPSAIQGIFSRFGGPIGVARDIIAVLLAFGLYVLFVRVVERRAPDEIAARPAIKETALGFGWGVLLMGVVIGALALMGCYHVTGHNGRNVLWAIVAMTIASGFFEELLLRAVVFRITEEGLGTIAAIVLSAVLFGFAHAANPNATLTSNVAIALEAGTLLAAAYLWRRRLWLAVGIHAGWNFAQASFGAPVSGNDIPGVLTAKLSGPEWLTGGAFGPEAGLVALGVCLVAFAYLMRLALKREPLRVPVWMRRLSRPS